MWATSLGAVVGPDGGLRAPKELFWDPKVVPNWSKLMQFDVFWVGFEGYVTFNDFQNSQLKLQTKKETNSNIPLHEC